MAHKKTLVNEYANKCIAPILITCPKVPTPAAVLIMKLKNC